MTDSSLTDNRAGQAGGGIYNNAEANLQNVTLLNNTGGLYRARGATITRAADTVWQNPDSPNCAGVTTVSSAWLRR
ncbi:hypothetical protein OG223_01730 [Streptomyces sp. NBC_01478]|uniref:hypothetical protein n=1 Tax=Streptomyces sp. NBC_01478 TaxID=2903882 RepID=UPI002E346C68|nr:hypothetical protein [Streptomyces sp. NBC_01478]